MNTSGMFPLGLTPSTLYATIRSLTHATKGHFHLTGIMLPLRSVRPTVPATKCTRQVRHASLLRRPKKPYTFTQLITLSDGSTFLHRTTSPQPIYRSTKDTKNSPMWNPSSQKFHNIEEDEAGRLRRFRNRFGRGFDAEAAEGEEEVRVILSLAHMTWNCESLADE